MDSTTASTRQRRKEARPAELAAAALALFVEKGFAATRLDDVAARAGVSKGTLYLYFDSKEALFRAVIEESVLPLIEASEARVVANLDDPARLLRALLVEWWECFGATPLGGTCKLMISEGGIARGVFRPGSPEALRQMVFHPLLMQSVLQHSMFAGPPGRPLPEQYFDTYFDFILRGLGAADTQEPR